MADVSNNSPEVSLLNDENVCDEMTLVLEEQTEPKSVQGFYRRAELPLPKEVQRAPGIRINDSLIRSLVFSTDLAIIRNCDADAVLAVYPFTCQPIITQALVTATGRPVLAGIAGAVTTGVRSVMLAVQSEMQGASAVVVNTSTKAVVIRNIARSIDIPVVLTVTSYDSRVPLQIAAGARIVNVAAGKDTAAVVQQVRDAYPSIPIIASGGGKPESILATIAAGADAISWTPPTMKELEHASMEKNRAIAAAQVENASLPARIIARRRQGK